jgi:hypothetical protein
MGSRLRRNRGEYQAEFSFQAVVGKKDKNKIRIIKLNGSQQDAQIGADRFKDA